VEAEAVIMASLLVRDIDDALHARLKARARLNHRSLEAEARETLRAALAQIASQSAEENPAMIATRLFGRENGFDLDVEPRAAVTSRPPPDFTSSDFDP